MSKLVLCSTCGEHHFSNRVCNGSGSKNVSAIAMATLLGLTACGEENKPSDTAVAALYGAEMVDTAYWDSDGDGFTPDDGDCDDDNPDIHPDATETPGDGVDSNCDGEDDT
jgi:hypothetical protein